MGEVRSSALGNRGGREMKKGYEELDIQIPVLTPEFIESIRMLSELNVS